MLAALSPDGSVKAPEGSLVEVCIDGDVMVHEHQCLQILDLEENHYVFPCVIGT
jgi:hypothetical protein